MKKMNNKGFSLVELIIVIAIMAVLMGVLAPQFLKYVESSRIQKDESAFGEIENAARNAASVPSVYNAMPAGDTTITIEDGKKVATDCTALTDELLTVVPDPIHFASKKYKGNTQTVTINISSSTGVVKVSHSWVTDEEKNRPAATE